VLQITEVLAFRFGFQFGLMIRVGLSAKLGLGFSSNGSIEYRFGFELNFALGFRNRYIVLRLDLGSVSKFYGWE